MKKFLVALCCSLSLISFNASAKESKCQYTDNDARSGLQAMNAVKVIPQPELSSPNKVALIVVFHNSTSKDPKSIDAMMLVRHDAEMPGKELLLRVGYLHNHMMVMFEREIITETKILPDGAKVKEQVLGPCFVKTVTNLRKNNN